MIVNFNFTSQTHLLIGSAQGTIDYIINLFQSIYCKNNSCNKCSTCKQITQKSFAQFLWLIPEKQYNLEQIDSVMESILFAREKDEKFFIIFEKADLLTVACSNRLLKTIEEPSASYYFLFLTERPNAILPTISSRCVNTIIDSNILEKQNEIPDLGNYFINRNADPVSFLKFIDKATINEHETINLIDVLIKHWAKQCKQSLLNNDEINYQYAITNIDILSTAFFNPIMPGSSKIFWKNLFLKIKHSKK